MTQQNICNPFLLLLNVEQFPVEPKDIIWTSRYLDILIEEGERAQATDRQKAIKKVEQPVV